MTLTRCPPLSRGPATWQVEEVIQIDNDSLLPYMTASRERERNEAIAEELGHQPTAEQVPVPPPHTRTPHTPPPMTHTPPFSP